MHPTTRHTSPSSLAATQTDIAGPPDADTECAADLGLDAWWKLIGLYATAFTRPSFKNFVRLINGWALYPGRRTVTNMITLADPEGSRAHDAYHRLIRSGKWEMASLWRTLATLAVERLAAPSGPIPLDLDDTLYGKAGSKVEGAGTFRDPVRSTAYRTVYAWGLNLVVLTMRVQPPWGGEPIGLPINLRLYRKGGKKSHLELAEEMIEEVAGWFPERQLRLCADGAYASLAGRELPRTEFVSRLRSDAALFLPAPERQAGQRGRPRKKGERLPTPPECASVQEGWEQAEVELRGRQEKRLLMAVPAVWYQVCPDREVLMVIARDPTGKQRDDYFFTTDLEMTPAEVVSCYAGRWSIEDTFRNAKQYLGGREPQCWRDKGPERAAGLSLWLYGMVWLWYVTTQGDNPQLPRSPWYQSKSRPSFWDALTALRERLWKSRHFAECGVGSQSAKLLDIASATLARAA
jgi:hypothetical protein